MSHSTTRSPVKRRQLPDDMLALYDAAIAQGWTVTWRNNGHVRWQSPTGAVVFTSATHSDSKAAAHRMRRDLRNNGLEV